MEMSPARSQITLLLWRDFITLGMHPAKGCNRMNPGAVEQYSGFVVFRQCIPDGTAFLHAGSFVILQESTEELARNPAHKKGGTGVSPFSDSIVGFGSRMLITCFVCCL